jgi:hypothetical protein
MSRLHFLVQCADSGAVVRDLASETGTYLNGKRVVQAALNDGDQLRAGRTIFRVGIERAPPVQSAAEPMRKRRYHSEVCESSLLRLTARDSEYTREALVGQLRQKTPVYLAANLKRAGLPQEIAGGAKDLFNIDQLPPNVSDENSLFVLSQDECDISAVVRDAWGKDALCLIVSRLSPEELTEKLKFFTGWFSRPSILRYQLQRGDSRLTKKLFTCGEAFLCEADSAESWSLYPTPEKEFLWEEWGFSAAPVPLPPSS